MSTTPPKDTPEELTTPTDVVHSTGSAPSSPQAPPIHLPKLEIHPPEENDTDVEETTLDTPVATASAAAEAPVRHDEPETVTPPVVVSERPLPPEPVEETSQRTPVSTDATVNGTHKPYDGLASPGPAPTHPNGRQSRIPSTASDAVSEASASAPRSPRPEHASKPSATSFNAARGNPVSVVLIASALETIVASKEAKRSPQLKESATTALEMIRNGQGGDRPREIFEPLRLACETRNEKLMIASLDCISKLISYSFFAENISPAQAVSSDSPPASPTTAGSSGAPPPSTQTMTLADLVTHTITTAYTESTPDAVSLQIVKALLALVLSNSVLVHHSSLLKAVRTVYNVFLLSTDPVNQMVAQGGLSQMVNHVFSRAKVGPAAAVTPSTAELVSDIQARLQREGVVLPRRKGSLAQPIARTGTPTSRAMEFRSSTNVSLDGEGSSITGESEAGDDDKSVTSTTAETLVAETNGVDGMTPSPPMQEPEPEPTPTHKPQRSLSMLVFYLPRKMRARNLTDTFCKRYIERSAKWRCKSTAELRRPVRRSTGSPSDTNHYQRPLH